jgi:mersacidin/lichenicidin family type 2 lantibiotic
MSEQNIIRAWKDEAYRQSLTEAERAALPENPVGRVDLDELTAAEMAEIDGGHEEGYIYNTDQCSTLVLSCTYMQ